MARLQRTSTVLPSTPDISVKSQFQTQAVKQTVGESAGMDPNAGNLSKAFSQFFSSLAGSVGQYAEGQHKIEMIKIERAKEESRLQGKAIANTKSTNFDYNATQYRSNSEGDLTEEQRNNAAFMAAFRQQKALQWGQELTRRITEETANTPSDQWGKVAQQKYEEYWKNGTGDPEFDAQVGNVWQNYYQQKADVEVGKSITAMRQEASTDLINSISGFMRGPTVSSFGQEQFDGWVSSARALNPNLSVNQARAKVIEIMANSVEGKDSLMALNRFIHAPYAVTNKDGTVSTEQSFDSLFPAAAAALSETAIQRYNTQNSIEASEAYKGIGVSIAAATRDYTTDANGQIIPQTPQMKMTALQNALVELAKAENQYGNANGQYNANFNAIMTEMAKLSATQLSVNNLNAAANGNPNATITADDVKNHQLEWIKQNADFLNNPNATPQAFADGIVNQWRPDTGVSDDAIAYIRDGLRSGDPRKIMDTVGAVNSIIERTGGAASQFIKDSSTLALYQTLRGFNQAGIGVTAADIQQFTTPDYLRTREAIAKDPGAPFGVNLSGVKEADRQNEINNEFWTKLGNTVDPAWNILWVDDAQMSTRAKEAITQYAITQQTLATQRGTPLSTSDLIDRVRGAFKEELIVNPDNHTIDLNTMPQVIDREAGVVPYANAVPNPFAPSGFENTVENVRLAVQDVTNGFVGLRIDFGNGPESLAADGIRVRNTGYLDGKNHLMLENSFGEAIVLVPGQIFQAEQIYDPAQPNNAHFAPRHSWYQNDPDREVQLTGDPAKDAELLTGILHPSISLVPIQYPGQDRISHYELAVTPFFKYGGTARSTEELRQAASDPNLTNGTRRDAVPRIDGAPPFRSMSDFGAMP